MPNGPVTHVNFHLPCEEAPGRTYHAPIQTDQTAWRGIRMHLWSAAAVAAGGGGCGDDKEGGWRLPHGLPPG